MQYIQYTWLHGTISDVWATYPGRQESDAIEAVPGGGPGSGARGVMSREAAEAASDGLASAADRCEQAWA